jgi:predicted transcriptional regulator
VIADVARDLNMTESRVEREFGKLHKNGFVYIVDDEPAEVRTA